MNISSGKIACPLKIVVYGPEGIGKSTFAAKFPNPVFIDIEGSTKHMDVARTDKPSSWTMLMQQVRYFKEHPGMYGTLIIDTADWAEQLCATDLCARHQKTGIEDFGYGKGYVYLFEEYGKLLNLLEEVVHSGMNVVLTAHAKMRKFEQPDEMGAYDRWEMKLSKTIAPIVKEWADMVLFANYKTFVVNTDGQGTEKGKNKATGGKRVMYTAHHPCWDAKNRQGLKEELQFDFLEIAHCIAATGASVQKESIMPPAPVQSVPPTYTPPPAVKEEPVSTPAAPQEPTENVPSSGIPKALRDLMIQYNVLEDEIQKVVASKGYYPLSTPIANYDTNFISGVLVGAWNQVYSVIESDPNRLPF